MTYVKWNTPLTAVLMVGTLGGCGAIDKLKDALDGEPQDSYCESLCDWAVSCAEGESSLSTEDMMADCLEATRATDPKCADAEAGDLAIDESLILTECTNAVDAMDCSGLTGSETDVGSGRPPETMCIAAYGGLEDASGIDFSDPTALADIGAYETYNEARNAVMKTGDELCDDVSQSICDALVGCAADTVDAEGSEGEELLMEQCLTAFEGFVGECKSTGLYDQSLPLDLNVTRWMADDCVAGMSEAGSCDFAAWMEQEECLAAFVSIDGSDNLMSMVLDAAASFLE